MISRKCCSSFLWLVVVAIHSVRCPLSHAKAGIGSSPIELTSLLPELPQADMEMSEEDDLPKTHPCYRFQSNEMKARQEFYSPGFEELEHYTNKTNCFTVLTAPEGHIIKLDFRDYFQMENDCKNDFLEVRDGLYGYDKQIGNRAFCGFEFPPPMQSTDRYLWIHFKSDENIEYKGFKAVYEFVPRPTAWSVPEIEPCRIDLPIAEEGIFGNTELSKEVTNFRNKHQVATDCLWVINVDPRKRIQLQFQKFVLKWPNDCEKNFIQIFSLAPNMEHEEQQFCGSIADTVTSKTNVMFVRYFTEFNYTSEFVANFTAFRDIEKQTGEGKDGCKDDEFNCEDATCISLTLKCNTRYNCRFRWDEDSCPGQANSQKLSLEENHIVIIMVIFSLILSGMCFTFVFNCVKKLMKDHQTIQEYIRQSREQQLNELDKQEQIDKKSGKSASRSRSNSSPSLNSEHFDVTNTATTPCYVPGGELLPILIRSERSMSPPNGDAYHSNNIYTVDNEMVPEMCDSACQTRESLFTTGGYSSGQSTPNHSVHTNSPPAPFSTFGYKKDTKFRAEAKIEVAPTRKKFEEKKRPYSVQTTKSAPDVIVTH